MAIRDSSANINLVMQEALIVAITELFRSVAKPQATELVSVISQLRDEYNLFHLSDAQLAVQLWTNMRTERSKDLIPNLMHVTTSFLMELEDPEAGYRHLANRMVPYSNLSTIVDVELINKSPKLEELTSYFADNEWLFFLVFAAYNMRLVLDVTEQQILRG